MINVLQYGNNIKVWWDYTSNPNYVVKINGKQKRVSQTFACFKNLTYGKEYAVEVYSQTDDKLELIGQESVKLIAPTRVIDVTKAPYNANGNGVDDCTLSIQRAIDDCKAGEEVYFPDGVYFTGALDVRSNVTLHLSKKAVIKGSEKVKDYSPKVKSRFEGLMCESYRSLINCGTIDPYGDCTVKNVKIYGGTICGGGEALKDDTIITERKKVLKEQGLEDCINPPTFYYKVVPGRSRGRLIQISNTENVAIVDCVLKNAPSWNNHFIFCKDVVICGCKVFSGRIFNGDGIDPDSCENFTVFDVNFRTGDDSIAIKSGKNAEGESIGRATKNVKIFSCKSVLWGHGISIGSEMSGGVSNVSIWDCDFLNSTNGLHIKTSAMRGGYVKNVNVYNCKFSCLSVNMMYGDNNDGEKAKKLPVYENFFFKDVTVDGNMKVVSDDRKINVPLIRVLGLNGSNVKNVLVDGVKSTGVLDNFERYVCVKNAQNVVIKNIDLTE